MRLPKYLEPLADRKIWLCHPMIWNPEGHGGRGSYSKPPIDPIHGGFGNTSDPGTWSDFKTAASRIGKTTGVTYKGERQQIEVKGVGIAMQGLPDMVAFDADSVARRTEAGVDLTPEVKDIVVNILGSYAELSPSETGVRILCVGTWPDEVKKKIVIPGIDGRDGELQVFHKTGFVTLTFKMIFPVYFDGLERLEELRAKYWPKEEKKAESPPSVCLPSYDRHDRNDKQDVHERWLESIRGLSDDEILRRIYLSGMGEKVRRLYDGDTSGQAGNHSDADLALVSYLLGFTEDMNITWSLVRKSRLFRPDKGKSYWQHTFAKAKERFYPYTGYIFNFKGGAAPAE